MADFEVRAAVPDDAVPIINLLADEPDNDWLFSSRTADDQRRLIETLPDNSLLLVAEADGHIIGFLDCRGGTSPAVRHSARIAVMVRKGWRRRGVGTALMQRGIDWADNSEAIHRLELDVLADNHQAVEMYSKLGFKEEGRKRKAYFKQGQPHDAVLMSMITDGSESQFLRKAVQIWPYSFGPFVNSFIFDMRSPLTSIKGYAEVLYAELAGPLNEKQKKFTRTLIANVEGIDQFLTLIRHLNIVQDATLHVRKFSVEPHRMLHFAVERYQKEFDEKSQKVEIKCPNDLPLVNVTSHNEIVFDTLLDNAWKYTPNEGRIEISAEILDNQRQVQISVQDTGIGMSDEEAHNAFSAWWRGRNDVVREQRGYGLGLTIARGLVERMGGEMWIESEGGVGTTVHFTLPVAQQDM